MRWISVSSLNALGFTMEKGAAPSLFVNDGSFMERFKQLQQENEKEKGKGAKLEEPKQRMVVPATSTPNSIPSKTNNVSKTNGTRKTPLAAPNGKLAFSLKQKSKLVPPPVKLGADEDEEETDAGNLSSDAPMKRQKLGQKDSSEHPSPQVDVAPPSPSDPAVKKVADKLASFVAKNGRQFEDVTRQRNPGDTPFKFLFDEGCADYKYYEYRLAEEEKTLSQTRDSQTSQSGGTSTSAPKSTSGSQRSVQQRSNYQIPTSALYEATEDTRASGSSVQAALAGRAGYGESSAPTGADPIAMMEFYMKKAAQEERRRQPKQSKDEMPPPASLQTPGKKGHHMGDYIPQEELEKFLSTCNDAAAQKAAREAAERAKIQADNVGHKLLSKMGWKEGEGLGSSRNGIADPIMAGNVKLDNLGVGAQQPGEVTADDDIYEQYKKRMMLGYRYRPNPLNNPRKAYY
ncbi:SURP and G-patch domain-containing protein 1-like protein isoform X2 [Vitis vinifera]|uniref:SURP and G-patch domain-containing protein 1-like protein isoform X2 n=2 Tax=Vitis TaxID=3603 RepID=UPI00053F5005|nr:SURP and G-patch domain-containing protein 1-like protein isoform X2 [Vitis vinifera]|eukprot:XP_010659327.1 PREDICTED: SURP and G-patch domain-containing protein 1-like protein isoform X1 [Vitis vinifera]